MNGERQSVESPPIRDERLSAIPLPVAERQGDHQLTTAPVPPERPGSGFAVAYPACTLFAIPRRDRAVHHSPCWRVARW